jgi:hypothetical protein
MDSLSSVAQTLINVETARAVVVIGKISQNEASLKTPVDQDILGRSSLSVVLNATARVRGGPPVSESVAPKNPGEYALFLSGSAHRLPTFFGGRDI